MKSPMAEPARSLAEGSHQQTSNYRPNANPTERGPLLHDDRPLKPPPPPPPPARDANKGREWSYPEETNPMRERIQALDARLKALQQQPAQKSPQQLQALQAATQKLHLLEQQRTQQEQQIQQQRQNFLEQQRRQQQQQHQLQLQQQIPPPQVPATVMSDEQGFQPRTSEQVKFCQEKVFTSQVKPVGTEELSKTCNDPTKFRFNVCHDLADFTGLAMNEVVVRMARMKQFHFNEEHLFWNPQTNSQLAWYYSTSQSYLFANAIHGARTGVLNKLQKGIHEPFLDYSGGVGNSVLYMAQHRGLKSQYFGIGMIEKSFAEFRVAKRGLQQMVTFLSPWSSGTDWKFDPIRVLPQDGSVGSIFANDVLEHIPNYHHVVKAMVDSLRLGGVIIEQSPFAIAPVKNGEPDTRIHVHNGGISMKEAMGDRMIYREMEGWWEKIRY